MKILLIDDHPTFRLGLANCLMTTCGAKTVLQAATVQQGLVLMQQNSGVQLIFLDIRLDHEDGLQLLPEIVDAYPTVPVLVMSGVEDDSWTDSAIARGAQACLSKSADVNEIRDAISQVVSDRTCQTKPFIRGMTSSNCGSTGYTVETTSTAVPALGLTDREQQVLVKLATGLPNKRIAVELGIKETTIKSHLKKIFAILEANTRTEAVHNARQRGWVSEVI